MIEHRTCYIYHIPGVKVGSSINIKRRLLAQKAKDAIILQTIPPNTLTVKECFEVEYDWNVRFGYSLERSSYLAEVSRMGMNPCSEETRRKLAESSKKLGLRPPPKTPEQKRRESEYLSSRPPTEHPNFKGHITNDKGEVFAGNKELKAAGYSQGNVSSAITGRLEKYKGMKWWRI